VTFDQLIQTDAAQLLILALAVLAAVLLHRLIWRPLALWLARREGLMWRMASRLRRPLRLTLVVIALAITIPALSLPGTWVERTEHFAAAAIIVVIGWTVLIVTNYMTERGISRTSLEEEDYNARSHATQLRVLQKVAQIMIVLITAGFVLFTFESVRSYGVSLFASAGAAGLVLGFAARPVLANLIAGIQIAMTQPIRLNDVVIVENEWGVIEEIRATYVIIRIWDLRRLVVPLSYFIEKPFQNWTRDSSTIIGSAIWHLDYTAPLGAMRHKLHEILEGSELWDGNVCVLQVVDTNQDSVQVRALMSARNAPRTWDLRCEVREKMVVWLQEHYPGALPRVRAEMHASVRDTTERRAPAPAPDQEFEEKGLSGLQDFDTPDTGSGDDQRPQKG